MSTSIPSSAPTSSSEWPSEAPFCMPVDPALLLASSETLAYGIASYAAAQNDVKTLQAFLAAGLTPGTTTHVMKRRGGDKMVMNPWVKAVENDAVDCVRVMMESKNTALSKLMSLRPEGHTAFALALIHDAKKTLTLWQELKIKPKVNEEIGSPINLGQRQALGIVAQAGDEDRVRWLLSLKADPLLGLSDRTGVCLEHFLAWGNCARLLEERLDAVPELAQACQQSYSNAGISVATSGIDGVSRVNGVQGLDSGLKNKEVAIQFNTVSLRRGLGVVNRANPSATRDYPAALAPLTPIGCALLGDAPQVLNLFLQRFGRTVLDQQAEQTLDYLRTLKNKARGVFYNDVEKEQEAICETQMACAMSACERWLISGATTPSTPIATATAEPRRRAVRL